MDNMVIGEQEQMAKQKSADGRYLLAIHCPDESEGRELLKTIKTLAVQEDTNNYLIVKRAVDLLKKDLKKQ